MRRLGTWLTAAGLLLALGAAPSWAGVEITQVMVSPQLLLDIYSAVQNRRSSIDFNNPTIIQLAAQATGTSVGRNLAFSLQVFDGPTWVARAGNFVVLSGVLHEGLNVYHANDISGGHLTLSYNPNYIPNVNVVGQGNILPMGNFRVLFTPVDPGTGGAVGPTYVLELSLFLPNSALNQPPIPIYPRGVEVNTLLPLFAWTSVVKAAYYEVAVSPLPDTNVNTYWRSGHILHATQVLYPPDARSLENGQRYYWQVRALDGLGNPIGGTDGRSLPADFTVNSTARPTTAVSPAEVETVLRAAIHDPALLAKLSGFQAVAVETTADDLAGLLQQLRQGTATVTSARVE